MVWFDGNFSWFGGLIVSTNFPQEKLFFKLNQKQKHNLLIKQIFQFTK
jgi:hypothetical protein